MSNPGPGFRILRSSKWRDLLPALARGPCRLPATNSPASMLRRPRAPVISSSFGATITVLMSPWTLYPSSRFCVCMFFGSLQAGDVDARRVLAGAPPAYVFGLQGLPCLVVSRRNWPPLATVMPGHLKSLLAFKDFLATSSSLPKWLREWT